MADKTKRMRRALSTRAKIKKLGVIRLTVHRTPRHIYAQIISSDNKVISYASTVDKTIRSQCEYGGNIAAAIIVGKAIAKQAVKAGVKKVAFDRSGFKYHGRIKALADAAREQGLEF